MDSELVTSIKRKQFQKKNSLMGNLDHIQKQIEFERLLMLKQSDQSVKDRYMMEVIDTIYKKESDYTLENVQNIRKDINEWANYQPYPNNVQARFIKRNREREIEKNRREAETLLNVKIDVNEETSAQKIKKQFNIQFNNESKAIDKDIPYQMSNFCLNENAYYKFKQNSTIKRTLKKIVQDQLKPMSHLTQKELLIHDSTNIYEKKNKQTSNFFHQRKNSKQYLDQIIDESIQQEDPQFQSVYSDLKSPSIKKQLSAQRIDGRMNNQVPHDEKQNSQKLKMPKILSNQVKKNNKRNMKLDQSIDTKGEMSINNNGAYNNYENLNEKILLEPNFQRNFEIKSSLSNTYSGQKKKKINDNFKKMHGSYDNSQNGGMTLFQKQVGQNSPNQAKMRQQNNSMMENPYEQMQTLPLQNKNDAHGTARSCVSSMKGQSPDKNLRTSGPVLTSRQQQKNQQKRFEQYIVKPFTDQELNKQKHLENVTNQQRLKKTFYSNSCSNSMANIKDTHKAQPNEEQSENTNMNFMLQRKIQDEISSENQYGQNNINRHSLIREIESEHPKKQLLDLIFNVIKVQRKEVTPEARNRMISSKLLEEYIKQDEFLKVMNQIANLKNQKPEYLRQFYEQSRLTETSLSETEVLSRSDYENSRLDTRLWNMIEKERKMKRKKDIIAKKKNIA